jgi:hypothetical protein
MLRLHHAAMLELPDRLELSSPVYRTGASPSMRRKLEDAQRLSLCKTGLQPAASKTLASRPKLVLPQRIEL